MQMLFYVKDYVDKIRLYNNLLFAFQCRISPIPVLADAVNCEIIKYCVKKYR